MDQYTMLEPFGDNNVSTETFINFEENCYDFSSGWDTIQASVDYNGDEEGGIPTWSSTYTNSPSHLESSPSRVPTESSEQIDFFQQCSDQSKNLDLSWPDEPLDTSEMPLSWIDPSLSSCFPSVTDTESRFLPGNNTTQRTVLSSAPDPSIANYICEYCSETYAKQHLLNRHIKLHTRPINCPIPQCSHSTAAKRDMKRHIVAKHPDSDEAQKFKRPPSLCPVRSCRYAKKGFPRHDNLRRHLQNIHHWAPSNFH